MRRKNSKLKKAVSNAVVVGMVFLSGNSTFANFSDINGHWAESNIKQFLNNGYIKGYQDGTFKPNNSITRAEFVIVVNNALGFKQGKSINFKDVKSGAWYYNDISIAAQAGYINGYEDGSFRPNNPITRQEVASIITSIKNKKDNDLNKISNYRDVNSIANWAKPSVEGAIESGYLNGYSDNTIRPTKGITRAESITTLARVQNSGVTNPNPSPTPDPTPNPSPVKTMYVTADNLNVRTGPGTSYSSVGYLSKGTAVEMLGEENGWAKINYNGSYAYVSKGYLTENKSSQTPLPIPSATPSYVDAPQNSGVIDPAQDIYQDKINVLKENGSGYLTNLQITTNGEFGVNYQTYSNGVWTNGYNVGSGIEGVRINLSGAPSDYHVFYRTKIKNQGWQAWVKDNDISGELENGSIIEDIEVRIVVSNNADSMVKPTIAIDIGHNVSLAGAINGIYQESYLNKIIGEKVIYKLRSMGYNVVNTLPKGTHTQSSELTQRAITANSNEVDKFVSVHFNSYTDASVGGTEVYYSAESGSFDMGKSIAANISNTFEIANRGAKTGDHLAVLKNTNMPAVLVEVLFITSQGDMDKFVSKGNQAYDIAADAIINGILSN